MSFTIDFTDTSRKMISALVDGSLDPRRPVVILMHGRGGTCADMTAPLTTALYAGTAFNRSATFPLLSDAGVNVSPPVVPVAGFFIDPLLTTVTSWSQALIAAGFTTVTYSQRLQSIATDAADLSNLAQALVQDPRIIHCGFAFVAHSRGGLVVRSFLGSTFGTADMHLDNFMKRTTTLVTLHSPNAGSGLATVAASVDALAAKLQMSIAALGLPPLAPLAALRSEVGDPSLAELAPGSAALAGIAAAEPVRGISYYTFGGNSTKWLRLWANLYTPDSTVPWSAFFGIPIPVFHWTTTPVILGWLLSYESFLPTEILTGPSPGITEIIAILVALAALTPELKDGVGDTLVTDSSARLSFSTHRENPLNHLEALYDPALQGQVIGILSGVGAPLLSGTAIARLHPSARQNVLASYTVTATDSASGIPLTPVSVSVYDAHGVLSCTSSGDSFSYKFVPARIQGDLVWPTVSARFGAPYGTVEVFTGHP
jgi:hypothetical protein